MKPEQEEADGGLLSRKEVIKRIEKQIRLWNNDTVTMACADMLADLKQMPASDAASQGVQMTPEQKQQLDQVIKRHNQQPPSTSTMTCWDDVDFLLSLVKSQEADSSPSHCALCEDPSFLYRDCVIAAADSMRYACVEKVKAKAAKYQALADDSLPNDQTAARTAAAAAALNSVAKELESLTLQEQEAKQ